MARRLRVPPGAKVAGIASTEDGTALHDGVIVNGSRGARVNNRATLSGSWKFMDVALTHVEGHTAGLLRQPEAPRKAVLVLSRQPCPGELGCRTLLPGMLPRGSELAVYVADQGEARYFDTYHGTGAGVAS